MTLREIYEKETGDRAFQYGGVPNSGYVDWLEDFILNKRELIK